MNIEGLQKETHEAYDQVMSCLSKRERKVLELRLGIEGDPHTRRSIANMQKVTPERIRQIEAQAIRKLRRPCHLQALQVLFESVSD